MGPVTQEVLAFSPPVPPLPCWDHGCSVEHQQSAAERPRKHGAGGFSGMRGSHAACLAREEKPGPSLLSLAPSRTFPVGFSYPVGERCFRSAFSVEGVTLAMEFKMSAVSRQRRVESSKCSPCSCPFTHPPVLPGRTAVPSVWPVQT